MSDAVHGCYLMARDVFISRLRPRHRDSNVWRTPCEANWISRPGPGCSPWFPARSGTGLARVWHGRVLKRRGKFAQVVGRLGQRPQLVEATVL
ncbi:hypothetical protein RKD20_004332 [Streptomyces sp. SLBN-8D4]